MAGSIVVTTSDLGGGVTKYSVAWTSDGSGNVNSNTFAIRRGQLRSFKFVPGSGGSQPSNGYSAQLQDADGCDLLIGDGSGLSNTTALIKQGGVFVEAGNVTPVVSGAGNATSGTLNVYVGP